VFVELSDQGQYSALPAGLHGHVVCIASLGGAQRVLLTSTGSAYLRVILLCGCKVNTTTNGVVSCMSGFEFYRDRQARNFLSECNPRTVVNRLQIFIENGILFDDMLRRGGPD
jgi:hypothetical protein